MTRHQPVLNVIRLLIGFVVASSTIDVVISDLVRGLLGRKSPEFGQLAPAAFALLLRAATDDTKKIHRAFTFII